ncbi:MAG: nucleotidyl transferase AbiEii/AbiGii toxin family protein [Alphaproteobacteria bacterium]|nr:nucleotidyl transferase AbiEii/AbiGii toxin family protein [Alphaproteobacteria bacterium]
MPFHETFRRQVSLLLRVLPIVAKEDCFALKGGTAINLFVRDLPRLSVDIDLSYVPVQTRDVSLAAIEAALRRIAQGAIGAMRGVKIAEGRTQTENKVVRLNIQTQDAQIKIEVTPVLRGCVFEPTLRSVTPKVEDAFGFAEIRVLSLADLYAGKLVAALDRQHPRDLFDVAELLSNEGIDEAMRQAFIVYLLSHNRPMFEVLRAPRKDIAQEFARGFQGMTEHPVTLGDLLETRESLIRDVVGAMPDAHRRFLVSFELGVPDWSLLGLPAAAELPAVRWRQQNLNKLTVAERAALVASLEDVLS